MTNKKKIVLERTYQAPIGDVWALWTTKEGIESWWGPEGFEVKVRSMDLRAGGELLYGMTATAAPQIEFMKKAGMALPPRRGSPIPRSSRTSAWPMSTWPTSSLESPPTTSPPWSSCRRRRTA